MHRCFKHQVSVVGQCNTHEPRLTYTRINLIPVPAAQMMLEGPTDSFDMVTMHETSLSCAHQNIDLISQMNALNTVHLHVLPATDCMA